MKQTITGKVSRVIEATGNFFILPDDATAAGYLDIDGHRVGDGEISAQLMNAQRPKIRPYPEVPDVGDEVTLELIVEAPDPPAAPTRRPAARRNDPPSE